MAKRYPRTAEGAGEADSRSGEGEENSRYMRRPFTLNWYALSKATTWVSLVALQCYTSGQCLQTSHILLRRVLVSGSPCLSYVPLLAAVCS